MQECEKTHTDAGQHLLSFAGSSFQYQPSNWAGKWKSPCPLPLPLPRPLGQLALVYHLLLQSENLFQLLLHFTLFVFCTLAHVFLPFHLARHFTRVFLDFPLLLTFLLAAENVKLNVAKGIFAR